MSCHLISTFMNQVQEMLFWEPLASFINVSETSFINVYINWITSMPLYLFILYLEHGSNHWAHFLSVPGISYVAYMVILKMDFHSKSLYVVPTQICPQTTY